MKVIVDEIPEEGLSVSADSTSAGWLATIFKNALGDKIGTGDQLTLNLTVSLIGDQVACLGGFYYSIHPTCARCGSIYHFQEQLPIHHHYIAATETNMGRGRKREEEINVAEDEDFSIYEGRSIELDPMLYEQLLLAQPTIYLCDEDCKGLCPRCGINLNEKTCGCKPEVKAHPFDVLKGLKVNPKGSS